MAPYNLPFIYTDEQAYQTLAAYGNTQIHMPHLNGLGRVTTSMTQTPSLYRQISTISWAKSIL